MVIGRCETLDYTCVFFFFQAEDGIRDLTVTGVQTCALPILAGQGDRHQEAAVWDSLGLIHHRLGHHARAIACYHEAIGRFRANGHRYLEAGTLDKLGDVRADAGDRAAARSAWQRALRILMELDRDRKSTRLNSSHSQISY